MPPGNPKASFHAAPATAKTAEAWLDHATAEEGSWWPHWLEWIKARSGEMADAPAQLGNARHPPLEAAPGRYVMEK